MIKVISIDPGVMSGYCYGEVTDERKLRYFPFQITDDVDDLWRRLIDFEPRIIVIEDFEFRGGRGRQMHQTTGLNMFPVQLIGVTRLYCSVIARKIDLAVQKASTGKPYYTDTMLKSMGLYERGLPHGMDASRHLLHWFTFGPGYQYNCGDKDFATKLDSWERREIKSGSS